MPPFKLRDGTELSLDSNLPVHQFPEDLKKRLGDVLADIREFLKDRDHFPEVGTIVVDEQGNRAMVRQMDIDEIALVYLINGCLEPLLKSGKQSKRIIPVRSEPWPRRKSDNSWDRPEDLESLDNNKADGLIYRILGKYVDYDHD